MSTTEISTVGTLNAIPMSLPCRDGITLVAAVGVPVEEGIMFPDADQPPLQSFRDDESITACVDVTACTVVVSASSISNSS
jgi:hypothetical protein